MTDEEFLETTKEIYISLVRVSDNLSEDIDVGLPPRFNLDVKYHKMHGQEPQQAADLIYKAETM